MGWFLFGLVVAVVLVWSHRRNKENETLYSAGTNAKQCPHCAEWVKAEAKICRYCQREVPPAAPIGGADLLAALRATGDGVRYAKRPERVQYGMARTESVKAAIAWFIASFVGVSMLIALLGQLAK